MDRKAAHWRRLWTAVALTLATLGSLAVAQVPLAAAQQQSNSDMLFGFNDHPLSGHDPADAATMLDRADQMGAQIMRIDVHWPWFEWQQPGRANWNADQVRLLDAYLNAASQRNIAVELVVTGTPCWAAAGPPRDCSQPQVREAAQNAAPRNEQEYAAFASEIVRFAAGRAQYVEVGNEPNHPDFWAQPDPAAYTRLLQAAYGAIKGADPNVAVVGGGLAPGNPRGARLDTLAFLHGMYAAGARGFFDYLEFHPYSDGHSPDWFDPNWVLFSFQHSVPAVRAEMLANGDDRPMILGEFGWTTVDSHACSDCGSVAMGVSSDQQANFLTSAIQIARDWDYVHSLIVYELVDWGAPNSNASIDHFGVLDRSLQPKAAAQVLASQAQAARAAASASAPPAQ